MIFDHIMFDFWGVLPAVFYDYPNGTKISQNIYNFAVEYWYADWRIAIRYVVIFVFLALTGICCSFSKSNLKRGGKLFVVSFILTLVTVIISQIFKDPDMMITFGILHAISFSLIIVGLAEKVISSKWFYLIFGLILTGLGIYFEANCVFLSYEGQNVTLLILKQMAGIVSCGGDSSSLILTCGQVFIGVFLGKLLYRERKSLFNLKYRSDPLCFIGRHSLLIYLAHQLIMPVLLSLIFFCFGFHFIV